MNTKKLTDWLGGGWRQDLGENKNIAQKNANNEGEKEGCANHNEPDCEKCTYEDKLESTFNPKDHENKS